MSNQNRRFALVVGNGGYPEGFALDSPPLDAASIGAQLSSLQFQVTSGIDLSFEAITALLDQFVNALKTAPAETVLFYFSGHGLQLRNRNYIVPIDFQSERDGKVKLVDVQCVIERISEVGSTRIILLDACRDGDSGDKQTAYLQTFEDQLVNKSIAADSGDEGPLAAGELRSKFATMNEGDNTFIAFATASGEVAYGGKGKLLSAFTAAFVKYMSAVDLPLTNLTSRVRVEVLKQTGQRQNTWDQSSLRSSFFFNPSSFLMFAGNAMALVGLFPALVPCCFLLVAHQSWEWIAVSATLPLFSLAILLFGMQSMYSRLRGSFDADLVTQPRLVDHLVVSAQKGTIGGYLGSLFGSLGIAIIYYNTWSYYDVNFPGMHDKLEPFGEILLEIVLATSLTACLLGFLGLFFARVTFKNWHFELSDDTSIKRTMIGAMVGGMLAGLIAAPILTVYFGLTRRPDISPVVGLPSVFLGLAIITFSILNSIVNFDFERLTLKRLGISALASLAALGIGAVAAIVIIGVFYVIGMMKFDTDWMHAHAEDYRVLLAGGAIYGVPVGIVAGSIVGAAVILTERWSRSPVLGAALSLGGE